MTVFMNRVLRKMCDFTREWRKFHEEELHDVYSSPHKMGVIKWLVWERGGAYRVFVRTLEGKRPLGVQRE